MTPTPDLSQLAGQLAPPMPPVTPGPAPDVGQSAQQMPTLAPQQAPPARSSAPRPILVDLIKGLVHPQAQNLAGARPTSRVDVLENFLGNFMYSLGQGFQAAHGPGAALKGAGAAIGAPYQLQQQTQAQDSEVAQRQAQTQMTQAQASAMPAELQAKIGALTSQPRFDPNTKAYLGTMNDAQYQNYVKGQGASGITAANRLSVEQLKMQILMGQVKRVEDYKDPQTGQLGKMAYNLKGEPMGMVPGALPSSSYLPKSTSTVDFKEDENGNIVALPKTSTSGVQLPATPGIGTPAPSGFPKGGGAGPRTVLRGKVPAMSTGTSPDGRQVAGTPEELRAAGVTNLTKMEASDASKVSVARQLTGPGGLFDLINQDLAQFKPGELSVLNARSKEFMAGTVGSGDKRFVNLRTHVDLLKTALMQAHVGSKGGEGFMEDFGNLANAKKMDSDTLGAAVAAEKKYVMEKAMRPLPKNGNVDSLVKKYGGS